jgi:hypothetical protein
LWLTDTRSFSLVTCPTCHSEFLAAYGSVARSNDHCPFCKLVQRYGTDPRVQGAFPVQPLAAPSPEQLGMLTLLRQQALQRDALPATETRLPRDGSTGAREAALGEHVPGANLGERLRKS